MKTVVFDLKCHELIPNGQINKKVIIGLDDSLVPIKRQAI